MTARRGVVVTARGWEAALVTTLFGLAALAWLVTARLAAPDMRRGVLTGAEPTMTMASASAGSAIVTLFLVTWLVMMVAMMFPAVAPVVVTFDRWVRRTRPSRWATMLFVAGYVAVWTASGLAVYVVAVHLGPRLPSGTNALRWGGTLLILAGAYQLSPLKQVCLRHCRSPLAFVARYAEPLRQGGVAAARIGAVHGAYCLGCCWALMFVLVLLGMMNLAWMAAVSAVIFFEKVLPRGPLVSRIVALLLIAVGSLLTVSPHRLPPLG